MNQDLEAHRIYQRLDDPIRILYWTVDEALLLFLPPIIGVVVDYALSCLILGIGGFFLIRKIKKKFGGGTLKHMMYWYFPHNFMKLPKTPPSFIRHYLG